MEKRNETLEIAVQINDLVLEASDKNILLDVVKMMAANMRETLLRNLQMAEMKK